MGSTHDPWRRPEATQAADLIAIPSFLCSLSTSIFRYRLASNQLS